MKKIILASLILVFVSCKKDKLPVTCPDNVFIEQYNTRTGGVARYLYPYDCTLTEEENFAQCDCYISEEISCRVKTLN